MVDYSNRVFEMHMVSNCVRSAGTLSGGQRIFIELARRWAGYGHRIIVYTDEEGQELFQKQKLDNVEYVLWPRGRVRAIKMGLFIFYLYGCLRGVWYALTRLPKPQNSDETPRLVFSFSDFWSSSIPAFVMGRVLKAPWVASFFMYPPNPFKGFNLAGKIKFPNLKDLMYYVSNKPIYHLIKRFADVVFVTSQPDVEGFICRRLPAEKILVIKGGVDTQLSQHVPAPSQNKYDAVFIGRFHPQKGTLELVDIWAKVCQVKPEAQLAMIGNGPLEGQIRAKIATKGLEHNIKLLGFMDGVGKVRVFKSSRIVVHPSTYDSGGMAAAEAMSCGLPGVSFDLPALKTYYPRGMLKAPVGNLDQFVDLTLSLLTDEYLYEEMSREAYDYTLEWDWDKRAKDVWRKVLALTTKL